MELLNAPGGPSTGRVELIMGVPYTTDLLYDDQFRALARKHPNFTYHSAISRENNPLYVSSLLAQNMDYFAELLRNERTLIYVCGLQGMEKSLFTTLIEHVVAEGFIEQTGSVLKPTERCKLEVY